jgi:hypothetical protein
MERRPVTTEYGYRIKANGYIRWADDMGGHIKGRWSWETIPEEGRENYRRLVRAVSPTLVAAERARADQAAAEAVREFLDAIPERIVTVSGRGGLREFAATWKSAAPTAEQGADQ